MWMARTRNSDPGRANALHYAATQWQRHAKRLVYAYLGLGAWGWGVGLGTVYAQVREPAPCVACQVLSLSPAQIPLLPDRQLPTGDLPFPVPPQQWHYRQSIDYDVENNRAILDYASRNRVVARTGAFAHVGRTHAND